MLVRLAVDRMVLKPGPTTRAITRGGAASDYPSNTLGNRPSSRLCCWRSRRIGAASNEGRLQQTLLLREIAQSQTCSPQHLMSSESHFVTTERFEFYSANSTLEITRSKNEAFIFAQTRLFLLKFWPPALKGNGCIYQRGELLTKGSLSKSCYITGRRHLLVSTILWKTFICPVSFLSDPSPIIGYACH